MQASAERVVKTKLDYNAWLKDFELTHLPMPEPLPTNLHYLRLMDKVVMAYVVMAYTVTACTTFD